MIEMQCMLHNKRYGHPSDAGMDYPAECPLCMRERLNAMSIGYKEAREQRDALVAAIRIVNNLSAEVVTSATDDVEKDCEHESPVRISGNDPKYRRETLWCPECGAICIDEEWSNSKKGTT